MYDTGRARVTKNAALHSPYNREIQIMFVRSWHVAAIACFGIFLVHAPAYSAESHETRFIHNARQLTFEGRRSGEAYYSPDDKWLIFQSEREKGNPFYQIYILSMKTGDVHRVSPGIGKTTCSFFQPGTDRVLFSSTHLDPLSAEKQRAELEFRAAGKSRRYSWDYDPSMDIFTANRDGSGLARLTDTEGYDAEGAFSPDGKHIVFCSLRDAYPISNLSGDDRKRVLVDPAYFGEIYTMNADGSRPTRLTNWRGYDGGPFYTPDGNRIVWRHFGESGMLADIYTMRTDGKDRRRLSDFGSMCWAPFFYPSGKYAIFTSNKIGFENFELYIVDAAGTHEPVRVTYTDRFDGLPSFSHDGKHIVWTSQRGGDRSQVFIGYWDNDAAVNALSAAPLRTKGDSTGTPSAAGARDTPGFPGTPGSRGAGPRSHRDGNRYAPTGMIPWTGQNRFAPNLSDKIQRDDLRRIVTYLASDALEGRLTGSPGEKKAARYIEQIYHSAGLEPAGTRGYEQAFPFTSGVRVDRKHSAMSVAFDNGKNRTLAVEHDFLPLAFSENTKVEGDVVFVGYGLTTPGDEKDGYNSYAGVDVKGKIALALRYVPEDVSDARRAELNRYAGLRYKAMLARDNGAIALLIAIGPNSPNAGQLTPIRFDQALAGSGIAVASITGDVASDLFHGSGHSLAEVQTGLDRENPHVPDAFALPGAHVTLQTAIVRTRGEGHNVLAYLPPTGNASDAPVIVVGAHYDHLGRGTSGSLAHKGEEHEIHNGADDNASGTAAVLEIAARLAAERQAHPGNFRYGILFASWSGEELGMIGSEAWTTHPTLAIGRVVSCINFDMVGRLRENKLVLQGVGSSPGWKRLIEKRNVAAGFRLTLQRDPYLPTDVTSFYTHKIPVMSVFTGSHEDYHRPTDDADKINYPGLERIARFIGTIVTDLARGGTRLPYAEVKRSQDDTGSRASLRAYLGTIPDYATSDISGVKLSGVRGGGPADQAGVRGGDIIVKFGGKIIKNIYDYTYALDAAKIGKPVEMVVLRDGKRMILHVTPEARK